MGTLVCCASELRDPERFAVDETVPVADGGPLAPLPDAAPACIGPLLATRCATNGCHDAKGSAAHLDLASPGVTARLKNADPSATGQCVGKGKLINPAAPDDSLVYTRVLTPPACGSPMPPSGPLLAADVACFKQWVESVKP